MFSKKTKNYEIFTVDLTFTSKCQIDGEDFGIFLAFLENMNFNMSLVVVHVYVQYSMSLYMSYRHVIRFSNLKQCRNLEFNPDKKLEK